MKPWIIRKIQGTYRDLKNSATPVTLPRFFQLVKIQGNTAQLQNNIKNDIIKE